MFEPEFAWACGLFEGEGSIIYGERNGKEKGLIRRRLTLGTTDEDVAKRFHAAIGCGNLHGPYERGCKRPMWIWTCNKWSDIEPLLTRMLPYLGARRGAKAMELLADPAGKPGRPAALREALGLAAA